MDAFHKILTFLTNPLTIGLAGLLLAVITASLKRNNHHCRTFDRLPLAFLMLSLAWLYLWSTSIVTKWIGPPLEKTYPPIAAENYPEADAICILGGGMSTWEEVVRTNNQQLTTNNFPEMNPSADRVWHGARLYKAGKANAVTITGFDAWFSTAPLLQDFGVPTNAIVSIVGAKNTEDEARLIGSWLSNQGTTNSTVQPLTFNLQSPARPKVLLVTSAWHMRRAEWLFKRAGLDVIPAACDYEVSVHCHGLPFDWKMLLPGADALAQNSYLFKEHFAYWCYRIVDWIK